jgi:hypothetical protein
MGLGRLPLHSETHSAVQALNQINLRFIRTAWDLYADCTAEAVRE